MMLLTRVTVLLLALDLLVVRCSLQSLEKLLKLLSRSQRTIKLGLKRLRQMLVSGNLLNDMPWSFAFELFFIYVRLEQKGKDECFCTRRFTSQSSNACWHVPI
jgi:hypothetical protein